MEPTSSASNTIFFSHAQPHDNEQQIKTNAQAEIIDLVITKLSEKVKEDISARRELIVFNSIEKAKGTQLPFSKCNNDLYRYMSQEREDVFIIQLFFDGSKFNFCINEEGKEMYAEI